MPNLIRSLLGRLRGAVSDRRRAPRYNVRLFFSISLPAETTDDAPPRPLQTLVGRTRNLSETGLGITVPSVRIGTGYLNAPESTLRILLDLPTGRIELRAVPARSFQLEESDKETGYFIGAQITEISDQDRTRYTDYLRTLRSPH